MADRVKERPILFSAPMVRAILDGTKTQTRRAAKLTDGGHLKERGGHRRWHPHDQAAVLACPHGQPGVLLWVREAWRTVAEADDIPPRDLMNVESFTHYEADADDAIGAGKLRPGMFMPRWASRILLEITDVRVERLQSISEADALAEGVYDGTPCRCAQPLDFVRSCGNCGGRLVDAIGLYRTLWDQINGAGASAANPYVWAISFRRITP